MDKNGKNGFKNDRTDVFECMSVKIRMEFVNNGTEGAKREMKKIVHEPNTISVTVLRDVNVKSSNVKSVKFDNYNNNNIGNVLRVLV